MAENKIGLRSALGGIVEVRTREAQRVGSLYMKRQHNDVFNRTGRPL